jgi:hypothetical protein
MLGANKHAANISLLAFFHGISYGLYLCSLFLNNGYTLTFNSDGFWTVFIAEAIRLRKLVNKIHDLGSEIIAQMQLT